MPSVSDVLYYAFHPREFRSICQWQLWHNPVHDPDISNASASQLKCLEFLKKTSRSFSAVIMELHPELLMPVALFYLVLRGLDTIEDDPSIPLARKEVLLREFKQKLDEEGWTFDGNRPEEKDRQLLVEFDVVIAEFAKIKPEYQTIIKDIAGRMGTGMADYAAKAAVVAAQKQGSMVETIKDYDLYCYYVAGLVGEGLTRLFIEAGFANPALMERPELFISMGLFLQKTNIIRDVKEDEDDNRRFWPREIWSKHVPDWPSMFKLKTREEALNVNSEMILDALAHFDQCLFYLSGLKEQSVFNFCAIPQTMALATLELCFRNGAIYERNIKISKGDACALMWASTQNLRVVCETVKGYVRRIHSKNTPRDPNFLKISAQLGQIEKFIASIFPPQTPGDATKQHHVSLAAKRGDVKGVMAAQEEKSPEQVAHENSGQAAMDKMEVFWLVVATFGTIFVLGGTMMAAAWYGGARFDLAWNDMKQGKILPNLPGNKDAATSVADTASTIVESVVETVTSMRVKEEL